MNYITFHWYLISCCEHLIPLDLWAFILIILPPEVSRKSSHHQSAKIRPRIRSIRCLKMSWSGKDDHSNLAIWPPSCIGHGLFLAPLAVFVANLNHWCWGLSYRHVDTFETQGLVNDSGIFRASYLWYIYIRCIPQRGNMPTSVFPFAQQHPSGQR